jgi:beta-N-acetylhexosaminidase
LKTKTWGLLFLGVFLVNPKPGLSQVTLTPAEQAWVEKTLSRMTLDEKIGQLLFPVAHGGFTNLSSAAFEEIRGNIQKFHVGGYHLEGGDPAVVHLLVRRMQELSPTPLLITADLEGGAGFQFSGATRFPRAMAIAATGSPPYAYQAAQFTAQEARAMGISVNFYPVVDVNNNPENPIINIRSFGEDPKKVGELAAAYVRGTEDARVIATAKHFPGHGDTRVDSHLQMPVLNFDSARLNAIELVPFQAAIRAGVDAVMTAHIALPQLEKTPGLPASLSRAVTTDLLRNQLGFKGLIFTDALPMHAITENFGAAAAAAMAIQAGADVALEPEDLPGAFSAIKAAVLKGGIPEQQVNDSVRRLLSAKVWVALDARRVPPFNELDTAVGSPAAEQKSQEIIEHALTLIKDDGKDLPLKIPENEEALLVNFVDAGDEENAPIAGLTFRAEFLKRHVKTLYIEATPSTSRDEFELIRKLSNSYRTLVVSCSIRIASYKGAVSLTDAQQDLLRALAQHQGPFVFALFGSPYLLNTVPELPSYALAYEFYPGAEMAMVRAIFGEIPFLGKLPVTVGKFPAGYGLERMAQP